MDQITDGNAPFPLNGVESNLVVLRIKKGLGQAGDGAEPRYSQRLSDRITGSFYEACRIGNLDATAHLATALEYEIARSILVAGVEDRYDGDDATAVRARYELELRKRVREQAGQEPSVAG